MQKSEKFNLIRKDGKVIDVMYYDNNDIDTVEILNIKKLNFEGLQVKEITKNHIHKIVLKNEDKVYLFNEKSGITAGLSKRHLNKIVSTVFTRDTESRNSYLKKELISNVEQIFYSAIPILKHNELKKQALYNIQLIHRLVTPIKIGGLIFLTMITVKERLDYQDIMIDEFSIYDLYSQTIDTKDLNKNSCNFDVLCNFVKTNLLQLYS